MVLSVQGLAFDYDSKSVLKNVSFSLERGEVGTLVGASGSGKSTLFKILAGILAAQKGKISIFGQPHPLICQQMAYMMQEDLLLPWRTVLSNVSLVSELGPEPTSSHSKEEVYSLLEEVGIAAYANHFPNQLSGGMRQRVSLARALFQKRPLLLLDEPFGALDVVTREQMHQLLHQLKNKYQTTILMITHDFRDALSVSERIFLLAAGEIVHEWQIHPSFRNKPVHMAELQEEIQKLMTTTYSFQN